MELEDYSLQDLRSLAKERGIKVSPSTKKIELVNILKRQDVIAEAQKKIAIHVSTAPVLVPGLGIFSPGYHIIDADKIGLIHSKRIRLVSPGEVAAYYGSSKI